WGTIIFSLAAIIGLMRIGVDLLLLPFEHGGARYAFTGLVRALLEADQEHHYLLFTARQSADWLGENFRDPRVEIVTVRDEGGVLPTTFLLHPAAFYRHKGHATLLDAAAKLRTPVVFVGHEVANGFPLQREITRRGLNDLCYVFSTLNASELRYLYRQAHATVL